MGATLAKLDSNDKVIEIIPANKKISKDNLEKLVELYNKFGIIRIRVDSEKMDKFIKEYSIKLLKSNQKLELVLGNALKGALTMGPAILSSTGVILIKDEGKQQKTVEGYENIEFFAEVNDDNVKLETDSVDMFVRKPKRRSAITVRDEIENIDAKIAEARAKQRLQKEMEEREKRVKAEAESDFTIRGPSFRFGNLKMGEQVIGKVQAESEQKISFGGNQLSKEGVGKGSISMEKSMPMKTFEIVFPKIYLTPERISLIEHLIKVFGDKEPSKTDKAQFAMKQINTVMDGLSSGNNPEIKIANLIGLTIRVGIFTAIMKETTKLGSNVFNENDMMEFVAITLSELLHDFPSDRCVFYNEKYDFVQFTPNICQPKQQARSEDKCPACPEQKQQVCQETKCAECPKIQCPDVKLPEMKCPSVVLPEMKCPPVVIPEMKCPPVVIPEIKAQEVKCPAVNIPEMKCPAVNVPEMKCPEIKLEPSSTWKYMSILLVLILVGFVGYMIWSNKDSVKSSIGNIANLSKLSK